MPEAHLPKSERGEKAQKHTCLGRTGASANSSAHLHENRVPNLDSYRRLFDAIRALDAAWVLQQNFIPKSETNEESSVRWDTGRALKVVLDHARWLEAELSQSEENFADETL